MGNRYYRREFLDLPDVLYGAYVIAKVEDTTGVEGDAEGDVYSAVELRISDCSKVVTLELDIDTADERSNTFHKLDVLMSTFSEFRGALEAEAALMVERDERSKGQVQLRLAI